MQYLIFGPFQLVTVYLRLEFEDREKVITIEVLMSARREEAKVVFIEVSGKKLYESRFTDFNKKDAYQACRRLAKYGRDCFVRL